MVGFAILAALIAPGSPSIRFADPRLQRKLGPPFAAALDNLLRANTVPFDPKRYNGSGKLRGTVFLRAGGGYQQPWTRDASVNSWNAASLIEPEVAFDTLWSVTMPNADGLLEVQHDNQWWDKSIWIVAAWNHYLITGDRDFLGDAYGVSRRLLTEARERRFNLKLGLFRGPSFFNDGIAGYPSPPAAPDDGGSSFVLDHQGSDQVMALSTNCVYVGAYRAAAQMAKVLGMARGEWQADAEALSRSIDRRFWLSARRRYGYLVFADGRVDPSQEGCGIAFSILFSVAPRERGKEMLREAFIEPFGIDDVYPAFDRFSGDKPGRHNAVVWPMVQGMWVRAAAALGDCAAVKTQIEDLAAMVSASGGHFFEIYDPKSGKPDGGWQNGSHWGSAPDQTWSASAYLSMVFDGLLGMRFERDQLMFKPTLPAGWDFELAGLPYRKAVLDIRVRGTGTRVKSLRLDGLAVQGVPGNLVGSHSVELSMR